MPRRVALVPVVIISLLAALAPVAPAGAQQPGRYTRAGVTEADRRAIRADADGPVRIAVHEETGAARLVGAAAGRTLGRPDGVGPGAPASAAAVAYLDAHAAAFGLDDPGTELQVEETRPDPEGGEVVRLQQVVDDVPVLAGELVARVEPDNTLRSVAGEVLPDPQVDTAPEVDAAEAAATAVARTARDHGVDAAALQATQPTLAVFDPRLLGGPHLPVSRLVWRMDVAAPDDPSIRDLVLVDAHTGGVVLSVELVHGVATPVCDGGGTPEVSVPTCSAASAVIDESSDAATVSGASVDARSALAHTTGFLDFLQQQVGIASFSPDVTSVPTTVRLCLQGQPCPYENAFWTGTEAYYGEGLAVDDIIAHELAHGLTQHTAGLFYYYQSGAINEALSDIWGELYDLATPGDGTDDVDRRWALGESSSLGAIRDMRDPGAHHHPDRIRSSNYSTSYQDGGGVHTNSGVFNKAAQLLVDGGTHASTGVVVPAIGADKLLHVVFAAQSTLLTSGSDYADLADALEQACASLIGSHGIVAADCSAVTAAVVATEMRLAPPGGTRLDSAACPTGLDGARLWREDVEDVHTTGEWVVDASAGIDLPSIRSDYASGGSNAFFIPDGPSAGTSQLGVQLVAPLPAGSHLTFAHAHHFDTVVDGNGFVFAYDGGVVEISTDGGTTWVDAGGRLAQGYTGWLQTDHGNPLAGRAAYTFVSGGYTTDRLDLSDLAGQSVTVRWTVGTDSAYGSLGWFVDDIVLSTCTAPDALAPTWPAGSSLAASGTTTSGTSLSWPPAADDVGVTAYEVQRDGIVIATPTSTSHAVSGLAPSTAHTFGVVALDASGKRSAPLTTTVTTAAVPSSGGGLGGGGGGGGIPAPAPSPTPTPTPTPVVDREPPAFPTDGVVEVADVTAQSITVTWPAADDEEAVDHYVVTGTPSFAQAVGLEVPGDATRATLTGLTPSTTYDIGVAAVDEAGNSSPVLSVTRTTDGAPGVVRLAGADRHETAAAVSAAAFPGGADTVYVATASSFPDALAAGPAAGLGGAPILLVGRDGVPAATALELARLEPARIVVLGGVAAVSEQVAAELAVVAPVDRLAGDDRYATAAAISASAFPDGADVVHVATGVTYADALAGAAAAGRRAGPVLLVPGEGALPSAVAAELRRLAPTEVVVVGGPTAVSDEVVVRLGETTTATVTRVAGADRIATATALAAGVPDGTDTVYLATAEDFPDALTGTAAAIREGSPIVLPARDALPAAVVDLLRTMEPARIVVLGGEAAVGAEVESALIGLLADG